MSAADDSRSASGPATTGQAGGGSTRVLSSVQGLRIRWDRLSIALVGAVALATALVTSVLAVVGLVSSVVPVIALVLAIASVAVLRTLALRDRPRTPQQAPASTEESVSPSAEEAPVVRRPTTLFNAEEAEDSSSEEEKKDDAADAAVAAPKFTAAELRAAALAVAAEAGEKPVGTGTPWQPVDVPKPTYVEAPRADREDPAPLDLPEAPKPQTKTPIKNSAVAPKVETASAPRMNLDDILQRRRA